MIPQKPFFIRLNLRNHQRVNELFSRLMQKNYTGTGISHRGEENYMHYPPISRWKYKEAVVLNHVEWTHQEITIEQLENFILQMENSSQKQAGNWYIRVTKDNVKTLQDWFPDASLSIGGVVGMVLRDDRLNKGHNLSFIIKETGYDFGSEIDFDTFLTREYKKLPKAYSIALTPENYKSLYSVYSTPTGWHNIVNGVREWTSNKQENIPEIKYETFLKLKGIKSDENRERKLIGYKLLKPEYEKSACLIAGTANLIVCYNGCSFMVNTIPYEKIKKAGVLDLWFEAVYQEIYKLPEINGYKGIDSNKDEITYGCAVLKKEWFRNSSNRNIDSMTLSSGITIKKSEIQLIQKYLENGNK